MTEPLCSGYISWHGLKSCKRKSSPRPLHISLNTGRVISPVAAWHRIRICSNVECLQVSSPIQMNNTLYKDLPFHLKKKNERDSKPVPRGSRLPSMRSGTGVGCTREISPVMQLGRGFAVKFKSFYRLQNIFNCKYNNSCVRHVSLCWEVYFNETVRPYSFLTSGNVKCFENWTASDVGSVVFTAVTLRCNVL
jgi:hypothetical protein